MTEAQAKFLRKTLLFGFALIGFGQIIFHPAVSNFYCVMIVLVVAVFVVLLMIRADVLRKYPISSFQVLGFWMSTQGLALFATTIGGIPLVNNMDQPIWTFVATSILCFSLLIAHWFYRRQAAQAVRRFITIQFNHRLGIFRKPKTSQIWLIGIVGLAAMLVSRVFSHSGGVGSVETATGGGVIFKFIFGMSIYSAAPFVIPFLVAAERPVPKLHLKDFSLQGIYFLAVAVIGVASNARSVIFAPIITVIAVACLLVASGYLKAKVFKSPMWIATGVIALLSLGTVTDFALAMQKAREQRAVLTPAQMLALSIDIYSSPERMRQFKDSSQRSRMMNINWDETYTSNLFLNRFLSTKFHDLGFGLEKKMSFSDRSMLGVFTESRILAIYPAPIINLLPIAYKKSSFSMVSNGDFMFFLVNSEGLGTFRTGSVIAQTYALWKWLAFPILGLTAFLIFIFADSLIMSVDMQKRFAANTAVIPISIVALMSVFPIFNIYQSEAYDVWLNFILRGFWQSTILFAVLFWGTSLITGKIRPARRPISVPAVR